MMKRPYRARNKRSDIKEFGGILTYRPGRRTWKKSEGQKSISFGEKGDENRIRAKALYGGVS